MLAVTTLRTLRLASYTSPSGIADALPGDVVAADGAVGAVAGVRAGVAERAARAAPRAARARVPRAAYTLAVNRITRSIIFTIAWLPAVQSKRFTVAGAIALKTLVPRFAVT